MFKQERWQKIIEILDQKGRISVTELATVFGISEMTVRRDLQRLHDKGLIERTHGGAIMVNNRNLQQVHLMARIYDNVSEKKAIAEAVAKMIKRGEKIYIGAGTTTYWVAKAIADRRDLTVATNSLPIANLLSLSSDIVVIVVGGFLRRKEYSLVGHFTENQVRDLH